MTNEPLLTDRFADALTLANRIHFDQTRKGIPVPYISHLMAVSGLVLEANASLHSPHMEDMAIAALFHDSIEDQSDRISLQEIEQQFGPKVREIVAGCTDSDVAPDAPRPPWRERKEAYIDSIASKSHETLVVACADKTHNLRCILQDHDAIGDAIWDRFTANKEGITWYYQGLYDAFKAAWPDNPILVLFEREVKKLTYIQ